MDDVLQKIELYKKEMNEFLSDDKDPAEIFRIKYLGSKGLVKNVMAEMRNVPAEKRKEFGQALNEFKLFVEKKYEELKRSTVNGQQSMVYGLWSVVFFCSLPAAFILFMMCQSTIQK